MIKVKITLDIKASTERVFDLLADHTQHPLWDPNMIEASFYSEGPITKGSTGLISGTFRGKRIETEVYYDIYDRPTYVTGGTSSGPVTAKQSCEFIATDAGTQIKWKMEMNFKGLLRLLQPFLRSKLETQRKDTLLALKSYIESDNQI